MADRLLIPDVFPERREAIEDAVDKYLRAKAAIKKAETAAEAKYETIRSLMENEEIEAYWCFDRRFLVDMRPNDPAVKVRKLKESEASPYRVAATQEEEAEPETKPAA